MVNKNFLSILFFLIVLSAITGLFLFSNVSQQKNKIVLGASLPLSGINSLVGKDVMVGANTYFSHTNARGGIQDKKIELLTYDDKYEPENTYTNTQKLLLKENVFALFGYVGTPTVKRALPLIHDSDVPFIAAYTGASFLRGDERNSIVNFRSSYEQEVDAIVNYLHTEKNITRFAIFYQNDDYGEEGYIALSHALAKKELHLVSEGTYKRNTLSIRHAIHEIEAGKPQAIILVGSYKPTAQFIEKMKEASQEPILFCPISFVNADALMQELKGNGKHILFSQTVPPYDVRYSPEAAEYLQQLAFYYPNEKPSLISFEAYLAAKTVVKALKSISGPITQFAFLDAMRSTQPTTLDGIPLRFRNAQLLNAIYLLEYTKGHFETIKQYEY